MAGTVLEYFFSYDWLVSTTCTGFCIIEVSWINPQIPMISISQILCVEKGAHINFSEGELLIFTSSYTVDFIECLPKEEVDEGHPFQSCWFDLVARLENLHKNLSF